ncbi:MAG: hypothetical protein ACO3JL_02055 [Myxococcota bacterium]
MQLALWSSEVELVVRASWKWQWPMTRKRLGEVLLEAGLIDAGQLEAALHQQASWGGRIGKILLDSGFIGEEQLADGLAVHLGCPRASLRGFQVPPALASLIPVATAEKFHAVPIDMIWQAGAEALVVATSDPTNFEALEQLARETGKRVVAVLASESEVSGVIRRSLYGASQPWPAPLLAPPHTTPPAAAGDWFLPSDTGTFLLTEEASPTDVPDAVPAQANDATPLSLENTGPFGAANAYIGGDDDLPRGYSGSWWPTASNAMPAGGRPPSPGGEGRLLPGAAPPQDTEGPFGADAPLPVGQTGSWWLQASAEKPPQEVPPWNSPVEVVPAAVTRPEVVHPPSLEDLPRGFSGSWWPATPGDGVAPPTSMLVNSRTEGEAARVAPDDVALLDRANGGGATGESPGSDASAAKQHEPVPAEGTSLVGRDAMHALPAATPVPPQPHHGGETRTIPDDWGSLVDNPPEARQAEAPTPRPLPGPPMPVVDEGDEITAREVAVLRLPPDRSPMGFAAPPAVATADTWDGDSFIGGEVRSAGLLDGPQPPATTSHSPPSDVALTSAAEVISEPRLPRSVLVADTGALSPSYSPGETSGSAVVIPAGEPSTQTGREVSETLDVVIEADVLPSNRWEHTDALDVVVEPEALLDEKREHTDALDVVVDVVAMPDSTPERSEVLDVVVEETTTQAGTKAHSDTLNVIVDETAMLDGVHGFADALDVVGDADVAPQGFESKGVTSAIVEVQPLAPSRLLTSLDVYVLERPSVARRFSTTASAADEWPPMPSGLASFAVMLPTPPGSWSSQAGFSDSIALLRKCVGSLAPLPHLAVASIAMGSSVFSEVDDTPNLVRRTAPVAVVPLAAPTHEPLETEGDMLAADGVGLASTWQSAAERPLLTKEVPNELEIPARRRALEAPVAVEPVTKPTPLHSYAAAGPRQEVAEVAPWGFLGSKR